MSEPIETIDQLTADWLTAALCSAGHPCEIRSVHATQVGTGQMGTSYRLQIDDVSGSGAIPSTLIAKMGAKDPAARQRVAGGYQKECGFYSSLAETVDVRVPRCWFATISDDHCDFVLLLDDLSPAVPGVQANGCSPTEAIECLDNLAGLHAPRWNDLSLRDHAYLGGTDPATGEFLQSILTEATGQFVDRYKAELGDADCATLWQSAESIAAWYTTRTEPFTLTHGDYRLDNLMFGPDGTVTALDWQTVSVGPPGRDVAYFIGTCLDTDLRRDIEDELVGGYYAGLERRGVTNYSIADCLIDYRLGHLQGPLITVLGAVYATGVRSASSDAMFIAMASRSCAAIRDLGTLDLL